MVPFELSLILQIYFSIFFEKKYTHLHIFLSKDKEFTLNKQIFFNFFSFLA